MNNINKHKTGFSLIELMIAMVIGLLLLLGAGTMFMSNQRTFRDQNELGLLQDNARFLMNLLVRDIRRAAFVGCVDEISDVNNILNGTVDTSITNFTESATSNLIEGSENGANWLPSNSTESVASMITNTSGTASDGITVRYLKSSGIAVTAQMVSDTDPLTTNGTTGLIQGSFLAVGDCGGTDIFRISNTDGNDTGIIRHAAGAINGLPGNSTGSLSRTYGTTAQVYKLANYRYYIASSASGSGPAFWRQTPGGTEELVEGVESLQILFGEDTSGDSIANSFVTSDTVIDWSNVTSVKIAVLMRTIDTNPTNDIDTTVYNLLGTNIGPMNDTRRRRIFTSTVEIRNKQS